MGKPPEELRQEILIMNKHGFIGFADNNPNQIIVTEKGLKVWALLDAIKYGDIDDMLSP